MYETGNEENDTSSRKNFQRFIWCLIIICIVVAIRDPLIQSIEALEQRNLEQKQRRKAEKERILKSLEEARQAGEREMAVRQQIQALNTPKSVATTTPSDPKEVYKQSPLYSEQNEKKIGWYVSPEEKALAREQEVDASDDNKPYTKSLLWNEDSGIKIKWYTPPATDPIRSAPNQNKMDNTKSPSQRQQLGSYTYNIPGRVVYPYPGSYTYPYPGKIIYPYPGQVQSGN